MKRVAPTIAVLASLACAEQLSTVVKPPHAKGNGGISGTIVDAATGAPLRDAYLLLVIGQNQFTRGTLTSADGQFEISELKPGTNELQAEKNGYETASTTDLSVTADEELRIKITLHKGDPKNGKALAREHLIEPPVVISGPNPQYTAAAIRHNVQGQQVIRCVITADGDVRACRVRKSLPYLDETTVAALEQRKYKPARRDGEAIDVNYTFIINLKLP